MNAKEFRLGNYAYVTRSHGKSEMKAAIKQITINYLKTLESNQNNEEFLSRFINPIPLTEEWLIKFGFVKQGRYYRIGKVKITFRDCWRFEYGGFISKIYYVHQLQNLYFALTDKELQLKN